MNMVAHTTDPNGCAFCVVDNLAYIGVHTLYVFIKNTWACGLDMEYDVQVNFAKRLCHNTFFRLFFLHSILPTQAHYHITLGKRRYILYGMDYILQI